MRGIVLPGAGVPRSVVRAAREMLRAAGREVHPGPGDVVLRFVDEEEMRALNRTWRGKDRPTDVLSFPAGTVAPDGRRHVGDVAICFPVAREQARRSRRSVEREAAILALHGLLHLAGYDHETDEGEMERLERALRRRLLGPVLAATGVSR